MAITPPVVAVLAIGLVTLLYLRAHHRKASVGKPLLKLPLIGDLHRSPIDKPLLNWDLWARQHGPIAVPKLFGIVPIVVLNPYEAVTEFFGRRSQWYSNRPASMSMEMITGADPGQSRFTLMHDDDDHDDDHLKLHHRILAPSLNTPSASRYQPLLELECKQLLLDLVSALQHSTTLTTDTIYPLLERTQSSIILALHYGLRIPHPDDRQPISPRLHPPAAPPPRAPLPLEALRQQTLRRAIRPLPTPLPPRQDLPELERHTKQAITASQSQSQSQSPTPIPDLDLAFSLATSIQGRMETTPRQLLWLFIAALQHPTFLPRAHALLDSVVGRTRLPRFSDRPSLARIDAITHELFRWRPRTPGSIPRRADRDDEFRGVKIPKGVTVMANAWSISRDETVFDPALGDPQDFVPEGWLRDGDGALRTGPPAAGFRPGTADLTGEEDRHGWDVYAGCMFVVGV
ncbi:cytochrome P450 [Aspergillus ellipticus CBS 707.79]|uniref:Cytochrome P450 n=1 Tax=Aspergillus ellipticus CBS 707.79 TaxID=1448320 RepID=A0A319D057_9EURO|nr:cytochrome P450 [Aspergillus ellipticus CBS 707.79]